MEKSMENTENIEQIFAELEQQQMLEETEHEKITETPVMPKKIKTIIPASVSTMMLVYMLVLLIFDGFFIYVVAHQQASLYFVLLIVVLNGLFIPALIKIYRMISNNNLDFFSGHIVTAEMRGLPFSQYTLVRVSDEKGNILNFKCGKNRKFVEGNPITFFFPKNVHLETTEDGFLCPFLTYQFSLVKTIIQDEQQIAETRAMTAEEYLSQIRNEQKS